MDRRSLSALVLILTVATAGINSQECMLNESPPYDSARTDYGSFSGGIQAIVPQYQFPCTGVVSQLIARVGNDAQIDLQIWRPTDGKGSYTLLWGLRHPTRFETSHTENTVTFSPSFAVPVERGDVIGFYTHSVGQLLYDPTAGGITVYSTSAAEPLCNFSVCDVSVLSQANAVPLISVTYESRTNIQAELDTLSQARISDRCSTSSFSTCSVVPTRLNQFIQTPAPPPPSPSPPLRTREGGQSELPRSGITSITLLPTPPPMVVTEESELAPPSGAVQLNFSVETIIISVIGGVLFVVLIILVVVLIACVCHKKTSSLQLQLGGKTELGPPGNVTPTISIGMSIEQTHMLMSNGTAVLHHSEASLDNSPYYSSADGENGSPGPPFRANGKVHNNRTRAFSSVSASTVLQNGHVTTPTRRSTSVCTTHCVGVVPPKTFLPPISTSKLSNGHPPSRYQLTHKPLPKPPESPPCDNDYSELDEPTVLKASASYDKLERYDRLSMLPDLEASCDNDEQWEEEEQDEDYSTSQLYTYVPTEEQRRILQLQADGHYEMHVREGSVPTLQGYDKLNFFKETDIYWAPATTTSGLYSQLFEYKYRELLRSQIRILKRIGCGHFGTVSKGVWLFPNGGSQEVAVKTVKSTSEIERIKLLQEAAIMGQFAHPNVVRLHGVVTVGDPVLIVLEYMLRGDLKSFLQKIHPSNSKRELPEALPILFIKFTKDIASGMGYLARKSFVHRDLAARNILLTHDLNCKIGDFGMARDIEGESEYYKSHGGIIPVKWTAPEALNYNKYSSASDVWSFGMVLFEIWSMGEKPFNDLSNPIVIALVSSKHCQPPPPGCPRPLYHLMVECWNPVPAQRPTFDSIHDYLDSPPDSLLQWRQEDMIPGKLAHLLGAPLLEANNLYFDLQRTYQKPPSDRLSRGSNQ